MPTVDLEPSPPVLASPREFAVPVARMAHLEALVSRLARKAAKLGLPAPGLVTLRTEFRKVEVPVLDDGDGYALESRIEVAVVTVSGEAPKLAGWTLLACLERMPGADANLVHTVSGVADLPESFRSAPPACDHCRARRRRKDTFVVRSDAGEVKQVGSSCLADFLGHPSPEALAAMCQGYFELVGACEDEDRSWGSREPDATDLVGYLAWVAEVIRKHGWRSRSKAYEEGGEATADVAHAWMTMRPSERRRYDVPDACSADSVERAERAASWARDVQPKGDYLHNVRVIARAGAVSRRSMGIAASILPTFDRELAREAEREARAKRPVLSEHVGQVKERLRDFRLECVRVIELEGEWGATNLHLFEDAEGRAYKWFASGKRLDVGQTYNVDGTVKKHEEYKGRKSTVLTRCSCMTDVEIEEAEARAQKFAEEERARKEREKAAIKAALADGAKKVEPTALRAGMRLVVPDVEIAFLDYWCGGRYVRTLEECQGGSPVSVRAYYEPSTYGSKYVELKAGKKVVAFEAAS